MSGYLGTAVEDAFDGLPSGGSPGNVLIIGSDGAPKWVSPPTSLLLTPGSVPYAGTTGALTQDNASFSWSSSNKRLGVNSLLVTGLSSLATALVGATTDYGPALQVTKLTTQQAWIRDINLQEYCTLTVDPGGSVSFLVGKAGAGCLFFASEFIFSSKIIADSWQTDSPVGGVNAAVWRFGAKVTGPVALDTTKYLLMEVDGVQYKLLTST